MYENKGRLKKARQMASPKKPGSGNFYWWYHLRAPGSDFGFGIPVSEL
jgi:hypothetical protein